MTEKQESGLKKAYRKAKAFIKDLLYPEIDNDVYKRTYRLWSYVIDRRIEIMKARMEQEKIDKETLDSINCDNNELLAYKCQLERQVYAR